MDLKFWQKALREAERELDAATTRTALDAAAKQFMRAKAELKRLQPRSPPDAVLNGGHGGRRRPTDHMALRRLVVPRAGVS